MNKKLFRRLISGILTFLMVITMMPDVAEAATTYGTSFSNAYEMTYKKPNQVTGANGATYYKFKVSASKTYDIYSTGDFDTEGVLYDANQKQIATNDDGDDYNFKITYALTANKYYYLKVTTYKNPYNITLMVDEHVEVEKPPLFPNAIPITLNEKKMITNGAGEYVYKFVPQTSDFYLCYGFGDDDTYGYLYDEDGDVVAGDSGKNDDSNFRFVHYLNAGNTYYLQVLSEQRPYNCEVRIIINGSEPDPEDPDVPDLEIVAAEDVDVKAGQSATLTVTVKNASEFKEISYQWYELIYYKDIDEYKQEAISGATKNTYVVKTDTSKENRYFICKVSSEYSIKEVPVHVNIIIPEPEPQRIVITDSMVPTIAAQTYTGSAIKPAVKISGLTQGTDYTVAYSNNTAAGIATVTVTGIGNYTGTVTRNFRIVIPLKDSQMPAIADQLYTGKAIQPVIKISGLTEGTDFTVTYSNNINPGTATATVTGINKYTGTIRKTFKIYKNLTDNMVPAIADQIYTGSALKPAVKIDGLVENTDFKVAYTNNTNVGTATVTITGMGNYKGTVTKTFKILKKITDSQIPAIEDQVYTGAAIKPAIKISGLTQGTDYTVAYSNNVNPGTATVTVTGIGKYTGIVTKTFKIRKALTDSQVAEIADQTYTGSAIKPAIKITGLTQGTDYTVAYANNTNPGMATITVTGIGNYVGSIERTFKIIKALTDSQVAAISDKTFTGSAIKPAITITGLTEGTDYTVAYSNNVNVGTATVTVRGTGFYSGTITKTFKIVAKALTDSQVPQIPDQAYTGSAITPAVTISGLTAGTDYTLSYANNTAAGTATVTVTGKGNYKGTITRNFQIVKAAITDGMVPGIADQTYTGSAITPAVVISGLTAGTDYNVSYSNNVNVGTATVKVTGAGKYSGTVTKTFKIVAKALTDSQVPQIPDQAYTGSAITPAVTISGLTAGTDYTVSYANNTAAGTATVTVTGKGNYMGTIARSFQILAPVIVDPDPQPVLKNTITAANIKLTYSTATQKPALGATNKAGATMTYTSDNAKIQISKSGIVIVPAKFIGKATITITAKKKGDYPAVSKKITVTVVPTKTTPSSIANIKTNTIQYNWKKNSVGTGYQVQYSTSKTFASGNKTLALITKNTTVSAKITKLTKNKTYYVRIRTYKTVGGVKYYSAWSVAKSVKITK